MVYLRFSPFYVLMTAYKSVGGGESFRKKCNTLYSTTSFKY